MWTKLSSRCLLPPNHTLFFRNLSLFSPLVKVTFVLALCLSSSARMFPIAIDESSHLGVQASVMLSVPVSISACILSISFRFQPYLLRFMVRTLSMCHLYFPVTSMISEVYFLAARSSNLGCSGSSMLLVAVGPVSPLRFPFSLSIGL